MTPLKQSDATLDHVYVCYTYDAFFTTILDGGKTKENVWSQ